MTIIVFQFLSNSHFDFIFEVKFKIQNILKSNDCKEPLMVIMSLLPVQQFTNNQWL